MCANSGEAFLKATLRSGEISCPLNPWVRASRFRTERSRHLANPMVSIFRLDDFMVQMPSFQPVGLQGRAS